MKTSEHDRRDVPREQTPRGEDPARLNDLNQDAKSPDSMPEDVSRDPNKERDEGVQNPKRNTPSQQQKSVTDV